MRLLRRALGIGIDSPFRGKFTRDVIWNSASLLALVVSGLAITVGIGRFYGPSALGVFQQVYVFYMVLSQVAVAGIHYSVLRHIPEHASDRHACDCLVSAAVITVVPVAVVMTVAAFLLRSQLGSLLRSADVAEGLGWALPGIPFFAVNKVLLAVVNANRHMRAYAMLQAMRYLSIGLLLIAAIASSLPASKLPMVMAGTEILLLLVLGPYALRLFSPNSPRRWVGWPAKHIRFGLKSFASGLLIEANTRVDTLMLGVFASDHVVGIYSMAAIVAEGFLQFPAILQANVNPIVGRRYFGGHLKELESLIRQGIRLSYMAIGVIMLFASIGYPVFVRLMVGGFDFAAGWPAFGILAAGIVSAAGYLPFRMLLVQTGFPGVHCLWVFGTLLVNIALNVVFIRSFGMYGAALATSTAIVISVLSLKLLVRKFVRIRV